MQRSTFNILREAEKVDATNDAQVFTFCEAAFTKLNQGYTIGNREHLRKIITAELSNGAKLSSDTLKKLQQIIDRLETTNLEEKIFLLGIFFKTVEDEYEKIVRRSIENIYQDILVSFSDHESQMEHEEKTNNVLIDFNAVIKEKLLAFLLAANVQSENIRSPLPYYSKDYQRDMPIKKLCEQFLSDVKILNTLLLNIFNLERDCKKEKKLSTLTDAEKKVIQEIKEFAGKNLEGFKENKITIQDLIHTLWDFIQKKRNEIYPPSFSARFTSKKPIVCKLIDDNILDVKALKLAIAKLPKLKSSAKELKPAP